jgi:hypothetical protein
MKAYNYIAGCFILVLYYSKQYYESRVQKREPTLGQGMDNQKT